MEDAAVRALCSETRRIAGADEVTSGVGLYHKRRSYIKRRSYVSVGLRVVAFWGELNS